MASFSILILSCIACVFYHLFYNNLNKNMFIPHQFERAKLFMMQKVTKTMKLTKNTYVLYKFWRIYLVKLNKNKIAITMIRFDSWKRWKWISWEVIIMIFRIVHHMYSSLSIWLSIGINTVYIFQCLQCVICMW